MDIKRDLHSGAIVNTNKEALNKYKLERKHQNKISKMESDITEIQEYIKELFSRIKYLEEE
jgi:hypothetical protein